MIEYLLIAAGVFLASYLIGSVNFAVIIGKIFSGKDVRNSGSGNAGATNVLRTLGPVPGILTFLLDAVKGFVACFLGKQVFTYLITLSSSEIFEPLYGAYLCCIGVMLGHIFPVFFGFKGGKAVACSVGTFAVCCPLAIILGLTAFVLCLLISRIVSLSSLVATVVVVGVAIIYAVTNLDINPLPIVIMAAVAGFIVFIKHKDNIVRLANGTEKKIFSKGKKN